MRSAGRADGPDETALSYEVKNKPHPATLFLLWDKHLTAVTKVTFPTIKLARPLHVPG
jgi:hypothetical protein